MANTGMGGRIQAGKPTTSVFHQATRANSASYPQRDGKWVPAKMRQHSAAENEATFMGDSFHMWINVWVAGKTVWSLVNSLTRANQKRFRVSHTLLSATQMSCLGLLSRHDAAILKYDGIWISLISNCHEKTSKHRTKTQSQYIRHFLQENALVCLVRQKQHSIFSINIAHCTTCFMMPAFKNTINGALYCKSVLTKT